MSVCVPDSSNYIKAYVEKRYFVKPDRGYKPGLINTGSFIDQINYIAYMDQLHKIMFDEENLVNILRKAPFSSVELRDFDGLLDLEGRKYESVYALAIK